MFYSAGGASGFSHRKETIMKKLTALVFACVLTITALTSVAPDRTPLTQLAPHAEAAQRQVEKPCSYLTSPLSTQNAFSFKQGSELTMKVATTKRFELSNACDDVEWASTATRIVSVSNRGVVSAKRPGVAVVTARNVHTGQLATCTVKTYRKRTQAQVRRTILALRETYKPGRRWTNKKHYFWQAKQCHCYGCAAFAGIVSDAAFGKYAPLKRHTSFIRIKIGDHVRIGGKHSVIVLRKKSDALVVAEGNYAGALRWGRIISHDSLTRNGFYVETRY
jgi:hypothetical protein